jgi:hypothetical protein
VTHRRMAVVASSAEVPMANEKLDRQFAVGDKIEVNMHAGKIVDATITAISDSTQA